MPKKTAVKKTGDDEWVTDWMRLGSSTLEKECLDFRNVYNIEGYFDDGIDISIKLKS